MLFPGAPDLRGSSRLNDRPGDKANRSREKFATSCQQVWIIIFTKTMKAFRWLLFVLVLLSVLLIGTVGAPVNP